MRKNSTKGWLKFLVETFLTPINYVKLSYNLDEIYVKLHSFLAVCAKMYLLLLPTRKNICNELSLLEIEAEMGTCLKCTLKMLFC